MDTTREVLSSGLIAASAVDHPLVNLTLKMIMIHLFMALAVMAVRKAPPPASALRCARQKAPLAAHRVMPATSRTPAPAPALYVMRESILPVGQSRNAPIALPAITWTPPALEPRPVTRA